MPREVAVPGFDTRPFSHVVRAGDFLFISGQTIYDPDRDVYGKKGIVPETRAVIEKIAGLLELCGGTLEDVVKTTVVLSDPSDAAEMNAVYKEYFPSGPPARTIFAASLGLDIRIEMEAIAYVPQ